MESHAIVPAIRYLLGAVLLITALCGLPPLRGLLRLPPPPGLVKVALGLQAAIGVLFFLRSPTPPWVDRAMVLGVLLMVSVTCLEWRRTWLVYQRSRREQDQNRTS